MAGGNLATPVFQGKHKGVYGPTGVKPYFQYKNDSGQFTLNGPTGTAIYKYVTGEFFSDNLAFVGHKRLGQPDDDNSMIGFDSGYVYKIVNEEFYFLFSDIGFPHPTFGYEVFRLYTSEDGTNYDRWKTNSGTQRVAIPVPPPPAMPTVNPDNLDEGKVVQVKNKFAELVKDLSVGPQGSVEVNEFKREGSKLKFKVTAHHKDNGAKFPFIPYSFDSSASGEIDLNNLKSVYDIKVCVSLPPAIKDIVGDSACVTIGEIVEIIKILAA